MAFMMPPSQAVVARMRGGHQSIKTARVFYSVSSSLSSSTALLQSPTRSPSRSFKFPFSQQHNRFFSTTIKRPSARTRSTDSNMAETPEPTGLVATKGIELLTAGTPNGFKASIILEELKEAYGREYTWQPINISKNTQKQPWFTAHSPNGRIPVIVDHDRNDFAVFEGLAILGYLARRYDPEHRISFSVDSDEYSVAEQWMAWQHGGVGPMQGQANHFLHFAEKTPYAIQRYVGEAERLYGVLNTRLEGRDFVAGEGRGRFSVADISLLGWAACATMSGLDWEGPQFANVRAWVDRCLERPAVQRGLKVPGPDYSPLFNWRIKTLAANDPAAARWKTEEKAKLVKESQEKYGYKFTTP